MVLSVGSGAVGNELYVSIKQLDNIFMEGRRKNKVHK